MLLLVGIGQGLTVYSDFDLSLSQLVANLLSTEGNSNLSVAMQLIIELRVPRVVTAIFVGANLALAGLLMQVMTRNTLASPAVLGINSGAACVVALSSIGIGFAWLSSTYLQAMIGAIIASFLVAILAGYFSKGRANPVRLILSGVAINALLVGITRAALIMTDEQAYGVLYWVAGSIANSNWESLPPLVSISLLAIGCTVWISPKLNVLVLGDDVAKSLGVNLIRLQWICAILIISLSAISVAVAGPIAFVGLIIPHVAKRLLGLISRISYNVLVPLTALLGSILLVWADVLSRSIVYPAETPVGLLTALIGTPVFIALACRKKITL